MSTIIGPAAAKAALTSLFAGIEASLGAAGPAGTPAYAAAVDKAQKDLETFFKSTSAADLADPAEVAAVRAIDELAFNTLVKLSLAEMQGNIDTLRQGAERLKTLAAGLDAQAKSNVAAAGSIGLKGVKEAIDQMTTIVNSVKKLRDGLKADNPDEKAIADEIAKLVGQFETLKDKVDKIA
jgi:hypothetical protein